jgi:hypothetical protein
MRNQNNNKKRPNHSLAQVSSTITTFRVLYSQLHKLPHYLSIMLWEESHKHAGFPSSKYYHKINPKHKFTPLFTLGAHLRTK